MRERTSPESPPSPSSTEPRETPGRGPSTKVSRCPCCGRRTVQLTAQPGRVCRYRNAALTLPADLPIPTCRRCKHQILSFESVPGLAAVLEATYRAERQYHAVEPENRIVARTLETRWNQKLQELLQVEREYEEARRAHKLELSDEDKQAIVALAADLSKVWNAPTTTTTERKQLLRLVIEDIVLVPVTGPPRATQIRILWKTGAVTEATVQRPLSKGRHRTSAEVVALLAEQVQLGKSNLEMAEDLNQRNLKSGLGREFTPRLVSRLCQDYGLTRRAPAGGNRPGQRAAQRDARGRYSVAGLVARYQVSSHVVRCLTVNHRKRRPSRALPASHIRPAGAWLW